MDAKAERRAAEELQDALDHLEAQGKREKPAVSRRDARAVLLPFGSLLCAGSEGTAAAAERLRRLTARFDEAWRTAVTEELRLAGAEYVMSVDERYLGMPDYDFEYTTGARERLESRLRACEELGYALPEGLRERVADADEVYRPYVERRQGS